MSQLKAILSFLLLISLLGNNSFSQRIFSGSIDFKVDYSGQGADQLKGAVPTGFRFEVGKEGMKVRQAGGMTDKMGMENMVQFQLGGRYIVIHGKARAIRMIQSAAEKKSEIPVEVVEMDEKEEILGFKCRKYKVVNIRHSLEIIQYVWATPKLKMPESDYRLRSDQQLSFEGVPGVILKSQREVMLMGNRITVTATAINIEQKKVPGTEFRIPDGYEVMEMTEAEFYKSKDTN